MPRDLTGQLKNYKHLFSSFPEPMAIIDVYGEILMSSAAFKKMVGYKGNIIGKKIFDLPINKSGKINLIKKNIKDILSGKKIGTHEIEILAKKNERKIIEINIYKTKFNGAVSLLLIFKDITERKKTAKKNKDQNKFLNSVLDSLTHPFYVIDTNDYTVKIANKAAGFSKSRKTTCYSFIHRVNSPCSGKRHPCPIQEIKKTKKHVTTEHVHYDKYGNLKNYELHGYPIFDDKGNVVQMIEYALDITKRKKAQQELAHAHTLLLAAIEQSSAGIVIADGATEKIIIANSAGLGIRRRGKKVLTGIKAKQYQKKWQLYKPNGDACKAKDLPLPKAIRFGKTYESELFIKRPNGEKRWILATASPIRNNKGKIIAGIVIFPDITEAKIIERKIKEINSKLEDTNALLTKEKNNVLLEQKK